MPTLTDPRHTYLFSAPGVTPRTISGEGTKVMLANAHPGAAFERVTADVAVSEPEVLVQSYDPELERLLAEEDAIESAEVERKELEAMSRDDLRVLAKAENVPNMTAARKTKATLVAAIIENRKSEVA